MVIMPSFPVDVAPFCCGLADVLVGSRGLPGVEEGLLLFVEDEDVEEEGGRQNSSKRSAKRDWWRWM